MAITSQFIVLLVCGVVGSTLAAMALGPAQIHPDHPDKCWHPTAQESFSPSESWPIDGKCAKGTCIKRGNDLFVSYMSCGTVATDPPCHLVMDTNATYPDCCPQVKCPETPEEYLDESQEIGDMDDELEVPDMNQRNFHDARGIGGSFYVPNSIDEVDVAENEIDDDEYRPLFNNYPRHRFAVSPSNFFY